MAQTPYLTPNAPLTGERVCYRLKIPNERNFLGAVKTALLDLTGSWRWEHYGTMTPEQCARAALDMYDEFTVDEGWCMIGAIYPYASAALPENTLACDGAEHLRVDYPLLYAALDSAFISDADHFRTPDLRGRAPIGAGAFLDGIGTLTVGQTGGSEQVTLTSDQMPAHSHTTPPHTHGESIAVPAIINGGLEAPAAAATASTGITGTASPTTNNTGGGQPHSNMQPFIALNFCIVAR